MLGKLRQRAFQRLSLEREIRRWRRCVASLRVSSLPRQADRTVLFCDLMTIAATAKIKSLIGGLLALKGYRTVVLLEKRNRPIERIFEAVVSDARFVYLDAFADAEQVVAARKVATRIISDLSHLQDLIGFEQDGFRTGRNVLSIVLRELRKGRVENDNPEHRKLALDTLVRSLLAKDAVARILKEHLPDLAVFNERGYTPAGEAFDGCVLANIDTIQWCGAPKDDCLLYRRYNANTRGEHPLTFSKQTWQKLQLMPWTAKDDHSVTDRIQAEYASGTWGSRQQLQDGKSIVSAEEVYQRLRTRSGQEDGRNLLSHSLRCDLFLRNQPVR